jgi:hypothetical protein
MLRLRSWLPVTPRCAFLPGPAIASVPLLATGTIAFQRCCSARRSRALRSDSGATDLDVGQVAANSVDS